MQEPGDTQTLTVPAEAAGRRLDAWLGAQKPDWSRAYSKKMIQEGLVQVNGHVVNLPRHTLHPGDIITCSTPAPVETAVLPEDLPLLVLHEDPDIIVINKAPGMVVHPAPGHFSGTLVNALLFHCRDLQGIGGELRPGIVHRLDKDTSGVIIIGKNDAALQSLQHQFKERLVRKEYLAIVRGIPQPPAGTIRTRIGRSSRDRKKMAVVNGDHGRYAVTHYQTEERFDAFSLVRLHIETGRTHQIRVHMAHAGHPVAGDPSYGHGAGQIGPLRLTRQMLHAARLTLTHPRTCETITFEAPLFPDMQQALQHLRGFSP
jgi:23S rRNA pseudouridine1911/1915/1917 synthase